MDPLHLSFLSGNLHIVAKRYATVPAPNLALLLSTKSVDSRSNVLGTWCWVVVTGVFSSGTRSSGLSAFEPPVAEGENPDVGDAVRR